MKHHLGSFRKGPVLAALCICALLIFAASACQRKDPANPPQVPDNQAPAQDAQAPGPSVSGQDTQAPGPSVSGQDTQASDASVSSQDTQASDASVPGSQTPTSPAGQISLEDAKNIALADACIDASAASFIKEKLDYDDGIAVYELEFYTLDQEYEYEIDASNGAIFSKKSETFHGSHSESHGQYHSGQNPGGSSSDIGLEAAKSAALDHAGLSAQDVTFKKAEADMEDGRLVYEIEFYQGAREYEYTILGADGSVLEYEVD